VLKPDAESSRTVCIVATADDYSAKSDILAAPGH
jgi:hypothetical protein